MTKLSLSEENDKYLEAVERFPVEPQIPSDEMLQLVTGQIIVGQTILVAYALGLFKALLTGAKSIKELAKVLDFHERSTQGMVSCACSMKLVECDNDLYRLSLLGRSFFDEKSPFYYGGVFDLLIHQNEIMNFSTIKNAILSNSPQVEKGKNIFDDDALGATEAFVKAIHQKALAPAFYWVKLLNLSNKTNFIDVAGGSGVHTIAVCMQNTSLRGVVCDRKPVLTYTADYIQTFGLGGQVTTKELDIWKDPFPQGDVFFFGDIFHDWEEGKCSFLAKKCYDSMPTNGTILIHEMLFDDDKSGPILSAAYNMKMLLWTEGQQYNFKKIREILETAGFKEIRRINSLGNWSLVIGQKIK